MISMCCFELLDGHAELLGELGNLVVLQQPEMLGDDLLGRRAFEAEVPELQRQALLQIAGADADRIEALQQAQRALDFFDRPRPHARDLVHRGDQVAVVVEVADDRLADLAHQLVVVGLDGQLPAQMVGQRAARRERVLDRRQLAHFLRRLGPVAVVEVFAEEILVVLVVPGVGLLLRRRFFFLARSALQRPGDPRWGPPRAGGFRRPPG